MTIPKLRFKEFNGEWTQNKIGDFFSHLATGSTPSRSNPNYFKGNIPWISSGELKSHYISTTKEFITSEAVKDTNLKVYPPGTMFIAITGLEAKGTRSSAAINTVPMTTNQSCLAFPVNNLLNLDLLYFWYKKNGEEIGITYTQGTKQQSLTPGLVKNLDIFIPPSKIEQDKVADFFNLIEIKLQKQQDKVELLKEQKKGLIQKIFSQDLRFKDEDEMEYSEWEKEYLNNLGAFGKSYPYSRAVEGEGIYRYIHYGDIHSNYPSVCENIEFPTITNIQQYELLIDNDIVFADASEDYADLGKAIIIKNINEQKVIAGLHTHKFTPNERLNSLYFIYFTQTRVYEEFIKKMGTGVSVLGISKTNLNKLEVLLPSIQEQEKIGRIIYSLDRKIQREKDKLKILTSLKHGFMQQMLI